MTQLLADELRRCAYPPLRPYRQPPCSLAWAPGWTGSSSTETQGARVRAGKLSSLAQLRRLRHDSRKNELYRTFRELGSGAGSGAAGVGAVSQDDDTSADAGAGEGVVGQLAVAAVKGDQFAQVVVIVVTSEGEVVRDDRNQPASRREQAHAVRTWLIQAVG